jgi:hypothetical protein
MIFIIFVINFSYSIKKLKKRKKQFIIYIKQILINIFIL